MKKKRKNDFFDTAMNNFVGLAGMGVGTAVTAGVVSKAPAGTAGGISQSLSTGASFAPIATTASMGGSVLGMVSNLQKKNKRRRK